MADKYKFLHDAGGVEYGQSGNAPVYYRAGDVVYGMKFYTDTDLIWVNVSGNFSDEAPKLAVNESILEKVGDENEITTTAYDIPPESEQNLDYQNENQTMKEKINNFINKQYTLQTYKIAALGIFTLVIGIVIGKKLKK